jgi:hypothetical protein
MDFVIKVQSEQIIPQIFLSHCPLAVVIEDLEAPIAIKLYHAK